MFACIAPAHQLKVQVFVREVAFHDDLLFRQIRDQRIRHVEVADGMVDLEAVLRVLQDELLVHGR